jgi:hypothetical protein
MTVTTHHAALIRRSCTIALSALSVIMLLGGCGGGGSASVLGGDQDVDPVVVDFPIAYVQRPLLLDAAGNLTGTDPRDPARFRPGADLRLRDRAAPGSADRSVTGALFPAGSDGSQAQYDVRDLSVSYDGGQLLFAVRAPQIPGARPEDQPTWNIWRYDHATGVASRIIASDIVAEAGQDIAPRFLPDGRILFASTRQRQARAVLLDEGKPQFSALDEDRRRPAFALHVMNADGTEIRQITFNPSGDLDPTVLGDGRIVFSRRDNVANIDRISLYTVLPDGREHAVLYGIHSHTTGPDGDRVEFIEAEELPDGRLLVMLRAAGESARGSALPVAIDTASYIDNERATWVAAGLAGPAQEPLFSGMLNLSDDEPALQGRYTAVAPLFDGSNRFLVSWTQCRVLDTTAATPSTPPRYQACGAVDLDDPRYVEAPPLYGIWMRDPDADTQQPIVVGREGITYTDLAVLAPRTAPPVRLDAMPGIDVDADLAAAGAGVVHIRSVYDFAGTATQNIETLRDPLGSSADQRPARFLRLVKAVSMPDREVIDLPGSAFGRSQDQLMREILGYGMIEPDGSVMLQVPANVAFWPEVLDGNGRRIGNRHQNWLQVAPGEVMHCNGCHTPTSLEPHGRPDAEAPSANPGAPATGQPFPNTDPALFADAGETMAEVRARLLGVPAPDMDVAFVDLWTDPTLRDPDPPFAFRYSALTTPAPVDPGCSASWIPSCRITIHYETHIHPLWSVDRRVFDADGFEVEDRTCSSCHTSTDAMGLARVPDGQLDLSDGASAENPAHFRSYRELLFPDNAQILDGNALVDERVPALDAAGNPRFEVDANGELLLDVEGNPIPILVTVGVAPALSVAGARQSARFFTRFGPGGAHEGYLTGAELRLLSEWTDIGAQYFNDPFAVPQ